MIKTKLATLCLCIMMVQNAFATVYYSKEEAFELAFGKGADIEDLALFLTDEQIGSIEKAARTKLESKLFNFHVGKRSGQLLGYAAIEAHTVRTQPETLLIVLTPSGELSRIEVLAFHEPPEYQPPARWFEKLYKKPLSELFFNQGIDAIAGATLSSRAGLEGTRKVLAIYQYALKPGLKP